jgi:hypothetical protein
MGMGCMFFVTCWRLQLFYEWDDENRRERRPGFTSKRRRHRFSRFAFGTGATFMKSRDDVFDMFLVLGLIRRAAREGTSSTTYSVWTRKTPSRQATQLLITCYQFFGYFKIWSAEASSIVNTLFLDQSRFPWQFREEPLTYHEYRANFS